MPSHAPRTAGRHVRRALAAAGAAVLVLSGCQHDDPNLGDAYACPAPVPFDDAVYVAARHPAAAAVRAGTSLATATRPGCVGNGSQHETAVVVRAIAGVPTATAVAVVDGGTTVVYFHDGATEADECASGLVVCASGSPTG